MSMFSNPIVYVFVVVAMVACNAQAQNVNVTTPFTTNTGSFYENHGVGFGFSFPGGSGNGSRVVGLGPQGQFFPNVRFQRGGGGAVPIFGGFDPNSAARFGFGSQNANGGGFGLGFTLGKGSTRQSVSNAPSLTTQNGFGGTLSSGQIRPFVNGVVPVVGSGGQSFYNPGVQPVYSPDNGVTRALQSGQLDLSGRVAPQPEKAAPTGPRNYSNPQSTAMSGDLSVNSIKAERERKLAATKARIAAVVAEAKALETEFKFAAARSKYREAIAMTRDKEIKKKINDLIKATRLKN